MKRQVLETGQIYELVNHNSYEVIDANHYSMRCIDGNYQNDDRLPGIAFPGGDMGDVITFVASAQSYGFEISVSSIFNTVLELIGGIEHFSCYDASEGKTFFELFPFVTDLSLAQDQLNELEHIFLSAQKSSLFLHKKPKVSQESALLRVKGNLAISPEYTFSPESGGFTTHVFVYQQTMLNERHRKLVEMMLEKKLFNAFQSADLEYLYQAVSETADDLLFIALEEQMHSIPLFQVEFKDTGEFNVELL